MPEVKEKKDWTTPVALVGGGVALAAGLYLTFKGKGPAKPPVEVPEGDWGPETTILGKRSFVILVGPDAGGPWLPVDTILGQAAFSLQIKKPAIGDWFPANTDLGSATFSVTVKLPSTGDWFPANTDLGTKAFSVSIIAPSLPPGWYPANTDLGSKAFQVSIVKISIVSFAVMIWGIPPDFGDYDWWTCYYYDPETGSFVGTGAWYHPYNNFSFTGIHTGGFLAVFLLRGSVLSNQYTSPTFEAIDGGIYQYDLQLQRVAKIG